MENMSKNDHFCLRCSKKIHQELREESAQLIKCKYTNNYYMKIEMYDIEEMRRAKKKYCRTRGN